MTFTYPVRNGFSRVSIGALNFGASLYRDQFQFFSACQYLNSSKSPYFTFTQDHFHTFLTFLLSCPKSCKSVKKFFLVWGVGTPLSESQIFFDILGKNHVFYYKFKFSRVISKKINSFYQNMFQLLCEKKILKIHTFQVGGW